MIINSDNACPEAYMRKYTSATINTRVHEYLPGLKNTIIKGGAMVTTAEDLAFYLTKLYKGELLSEKMTEKLIAVMKKQTFRQGIPAGIGDSGTVADKVGWLTLSYHDAAIVYGNKEDYVLVIMTEGAGSWQPLAAIAKEINDRLK
jgi:beta-lactamase class A